MTQTGVEQGIVARIRAVSGRLTPTEQRLVAVLLAAPAEVAVAPSADFAARAQAHEATTSRFARKLGFETYAAFRAALQREWLRGPGPAARLSATLDLSAGRILGGLIAAEAQALAAVGGHLDDDALQRAAALIDRPRLFLFGQGNATALAAMLERRLRAMGVAVVPMTGSARDIAEQAVGAGPQDAAVLLAFRRQPRIYAPLASALREAGVATLAVSDALGPALSPSPDLLLAAPRGGGDMGFQTLTVPMLICNALILTLGARRGEGALAALGRLGALIDRFETEPPGLPRPPRHAR
jgi:DNA-binding MurR/RpiR family transcriptional regulator